MSAAGRWFVFHDRELLVVEESDLVIPPAGTGPPLPILDVPIPVGEIDGVPCFAARLVDAVPDDLRSRMRGLRALFGATDERVFRIAGRALQIVEWDETHRFCGRCGGPTIRSDHEHARTCAACGLAQFPRVSPAVIVAVRDGDRILLGRHPRLPAHMYSVLAGFVEPGETLEETIVRELREEVGIEVDDIRYFGSQPWPFPHSLMVGFTARYARGELRPDPDELDDAGWFTADALPRVAPRISIARSLIDDFVQSCGGDPGLIP